LTDNPPVPIRLPRRSSATLFPLERVRALVAGALLASALLLGTGTAYAASGSSNAGSASGGPLSPGVTAPGTPATTTQTQTQATTSASTTTAASGGGSLGQTSVIGIVVGAVIVIGGVTFFIFRDAGRRAPSRARRGDGESGAERRVPGSQRVKPRKLSAQERRRRKRGRAPRRK
jgi:hypothetical protein